MKKLYTFLAAILLTISTFAQAPEKMSYQAVVRDSGDALVTNQVVGMQISILQTTATGTAVYVETQTPTTNVNGLVTLEIGTGTPVTGTFAGIDWSTGTYFIKTETDPTGGTSYTITGTSQLLSVPYALHANNGQSSGTNAGDMQYWNGSAWEVVDATPNEGAALQMIGGIPTWVGGTPPTTVPDAPTIGTALARAAQASVFFTAPVSDGGSAITGYTATSSPGGFTGTGTSPITVTGLTNGIAYTFSVTATNAIGTSNPSSASNSVTPILTGATIGDLRDGGIVFWVDPTDNTKGKVCMLAVDEEYLSWFDAMNTVYTNTDTGTGVYNDWYLPNKEELQLMYANLQRYGCSTNTPGPGSQDLSLCATRKGDFTSPATYWSSTVAFIYNASLQNFGSGTQSSDEINNAYYVRAVRAF